MMCQPPDQKTIAETRKFSLISVFLPILAGLLHMQVFYYAAFNILTLPRTLPVEVIRNQWLHLDTCVFFAYTFDLICCYVFKIIPFSRCNSGRDIAGHHLPILLLLLPLSIPTCFQQFQHLDQLANNMIEYDDDEEGKVSFRAINGLLIANGVGFLSSLNEVFMCFQRAEMNLQGVIFFRDIKMIQKRIFTSRFMVGAELYFKFGIFCVFSSFSFKACCDVDRAGFEYLNEVSGEMPIWRKVGTVYSSPMVIRGVLFRIFMLSMYPFMGLRTAKKIKLFHNEVDGSGQQGTIGMKKI